MELSSFVQSQSEKLGESAKVAVDLATLLDREILSAANIASQKFDVNGMALLRLEVFEDLSALCFQHGVPVPELEPEILELCRPTVPEKELVDIRRLAKDARGSLGRKRPKADAKRDLLAIARCLDLMPGLAGRGDSFSSFKALLNASLLQLGLPTLRPDFAAMKVPNALGRASASHPLKALVVDDDIREIVKTLRNLAGWPGLQFDSLHFTVADDCRWRCPPDKKAEIVRATVQTVLAGRPDIVIMDEGLPATNGGELIMAVKASNPDFQIEFVGSTGGSGEQLREAGALLNLEKGRNQRLLEQAVWRFPA